MKTPDSLGNLVKTTDGSLTLRNLAIDEDYHSSAGAAFEARELYINRSGFLESLQKGRLIRVLDVGLGLGYNALSTIEACREAGAGCQLDIVSLEVNPVLVEALTSGAAIWQEGWSSNWLELCQSLVRQADGSYETIWQNQAGMQIHWKVLVGDASQLDLGAWTFHYIWQDAFSPEKNPELWSKQWFETLARSSNAETVLMTYSVARRVKDSLDAASWTYERIPASGKKRHWLKARPV